MTGAAAERFVVFNLRLLAATFAIVGLLFIALPDGTLRALDDFGEWLPLGEFSVRLTEPSETPTYRESAAPAVEPIARGAASTHASKARGLVAACEGLALTTAALGMAPAIVALYVLAS